MNTFIRVSCVVGCAAVLVGCSSITPIRITPDNEKTAKGLRYWETRPFLVVRKPYPIASEPFLVHGILAANGSSFVVTNVPTGLNLPAGTAFELTPEAGSKALSGPARAQSEVAPPAEPPADDSNAESGACQKGTETSTKEGDEASESKEFECKDTTGQRLAFSGISLETDLTATAVVPVNDLFSVIYLKDEDREFYIESKARWGLSKLHITRGPGGTLLAYNAEVDNSAVVKPLADAWNSLVGAATKLAVLNIDPTAQSEEVQQDDKGGAIVLDGTPATLRVHRVRFAVPGIYPFAKPQEIRDGIWSPTGSGLEQQGKVEDSEAATRMLVPTYPYQVPYDYFTVLVAEHLLEPAGSSALIVSVNAAAGSSKNSEGSEQSSGDQCHTKGMPPGSVSSANLANKLAGMTGAPDVEIESSKVVEKSAAGCASKVEIATSGSTEDTEAAIKVFEKIYDHADFVAKEG